MRTIALNAKERGLVEMALRQLRDRVEAAVEHELGPERRNARAIDALLARLAAAPATPDEPTAAASEIGRLRAANQALRARASASFGAASADAQATGSGVVPTAAELDRILARAAAALPGPWYHEEGTVARRVEDPGYDNYGDLYRYGSPHTDTDLFGTPVPVWGQWPDHATLSFIAHAREDVPRLAAALRRLAVPQAARTIASQGHDA